MNDPLVGYDCLAVKPRLKGRRPIPMRDDTGVLRSFDYLVQRDDPDDPTQMTMDHFTSFEVDIWVYEEQVSSIASIETTGQVPGCSDCLAFILGLFLRYLFCSSSTF